MNTRKPAPSESAAVDSPIRNATDSSGSTGQSRGSAESRESEDADYFQARAEQELDFAQRATNSCAVAAHYAMAERYLERVSRARLAEPSEVISETEQVRP